MILIRRHFVQVTLSVCELYGGKLASALLYTQSSHWAVIYNYYHSFYLIIVISQVG